MLTSLPALDLLSSDGRDACTDYSLEHGLPDRLAPLAAAAGTSSRMLIYHFGTRDLRMFSRLHDTAGEPRLARFSADGHHRLARTAGGRDGQPRATRLATAVLAVIRGLLMDLDATGDTERTHRAFDDFLTTIASI
jgi:hypothetical protein